MSAKGILKYSIKEGGSLGTKTHLLLRACKQETIRQRKKRKPFFILFMTGSCLRCLLNCGLQGSPNWPPLLYILVPTRGPPLSAMQPADTLVNYVNTINITQ